MRFLEWRRQEIKPYEQQMTYRQDKSECLCLTDENIPKLSFNWAENVRSDIHEIIQCPSLTQGCVIFTNGSATIGHHSGWGFVAYLNGKTAKERSSAYDITTCCLRTESEATTA